MPYTPTVNDKKFQELLLYIAEQSVGDPAFGKTKLNKILYYVDFTAFNELGASVTGATYRHRPFGPVPEGVAAARQRLLASGAAAISPTPRFGYRQERLIAVAKPDMGVFDATERAVIDYVIDWLRPMSATQVSEMSHEEFGYRTTRNNDVIKYETVYVSKRRPTDDDHARADLIWDHLFNGGPKPEPVA